MSILWEKEEINQALSLKQSETNLKLQTSNITFNV